MTYIRATLMNEAVPFEPTKRLALTCLGNLLTISQIDSLGPEMYSQIFKLLPVSNKLVHFIGSFPKVSSLNLLLKIKFLNSYLRVLHILIEQWIKIPDTVYLESFSSFMTVFYALDQVSFNQGKCPAFKSRKPNSCD